MSLDEEFGIPAMKTPGVKKAMEAMNAKLRRSTRVKNPIQRFVYIMDMWHIIMHIWQRWYRM